MMFFYLIFVFTFFNYLELLENYLKDTNKIIKTINKNHKYYKNYNKTILLINELINWLIDYFYEPTKKL